MAKPSIADIDYLIYTNSLGEETYIPGEYAKYKKTYDIIEEIGNTGRKVTKNFKQKMFSLFLNNTNKKQDYSTVYEKLKNLKEVDDTEEYKKDLIEYFNEKYIISGNYKLVDEKKLEKSQHFKDMVKEIDNNLIFENQYIDKALDVMTFEGTQSKILRLKGTIKQLEKEKKDGGDYDQNTIDQFLEDYKTELSKEPIKKEEESLPAVAAQVTSSVIKAENELIGVSVYEQLKDDLEEAMKIKGYPDKDKYHEHFENETSYQHMLKFIDSINTSVDVIPITDIETKIQEVIYPGTGATVEPQVSTTPEPVFFPDLFDESIINSSSPLTGASVEVDDTLASETAQTDTTNIIEEKPPEEQLIVPKGNVDGLNYVERYHETSLLLYFQNSSHPDWDHILESNVLSLKIPKEEIISMMDEIISEFGKKIFVTKRKSDTLKELNELVQLQFCVLRNLHIGNRSRTATVKLGDLNNLQKAASGQNLNVKASTVSQAPIIANMDTQPINVIGNTVKQQTRDEAQFIKDYDKAQTLLNLSRTDYVNKVYAPQIRKPLLDHHSVGIVPGNNLHSVKEFQKQTHRLIKSKYTI